METAFFRHNEDFTLFGQQHLVMMGLTLLCCISLPYASKRYLSEQQQLGLARGIKLVLAFWVLFWIAARIAQGYFNPATDLPFDLCNMMSLVLPFLMWRPSYRAHEIFYFWILAGTIQAILTPHLYEGFPNFTFFKYWFVHGGLVIYAVYVTTVFRLYPTRRSIWRAFGYLQVYAAFVLVMNLLLGANYMYLLGKPPTASPLDFLGPWPWYLLIVEALALAMCVLVYLPVALSRERLGG